MYKVNVNTIYMYILEGSGAFSPFPTSSCGWVLCHMVAFVRFCFLELLYYCSFWIFGISMVFFSFENLKIIFGMRIPTFGRICFLGIFDFMVSYSCLF